MPSFEEKIRLLEQKKREYRERLTALRPEQQKAVEDAVWEDAASLVPFMSIYKVRKDNFKPAQQGLLEAFQMIRGMGKNIPISPELMADIHHTMLKYEDPWNAGRFRKLPARWKNSTIILSNYAAVPMLTERLCEHINTGAPTGFYHDEQRNPQLRSLAYHPLIRVIEAYYSTIITHPFGDANKRMARLNMAFVLARSHYIPMIVSDKKECVAGVEDYFKTRQPHRFIRTMFKQIDQSYDLAFHELKKQEIRSR